MERRPRPHHPGGSAYCRCSLDSCRSRSSRPSSLEFAIFSVWNSASLLRGLAGAAHRKSAESPRTADSKSVPANCAGSRFIEIACKEAGLLLQRTATRCSVRRQARTRTLRGAASGIRTRAVSATRRRRDPSIAEKCAGTWSMPRRSQGAPAESPPSQQNAAHKEDPASRRLSSMTRTIPYVQRRSG